MGHEQHRPAFAAAAAQQLVEEIAAAGVEAGVGLVEQQEPGAPGQSHCEPRPALLAGRQPSERHTGQPAQAELFEDRVGVGHPAAAGAHPEAHVLAHREVVVGTRGMTDEGQFRADSVAVGCEIVAEDDRCPGRQRQQAGQQPEERRLARTVGARHEHHLANGYVQIDPGQRRVLPQQADGGPQMDGGRAQIDSIRAGGRP